MVCMVGTRWLSWTTAMTLWMVGSVASALEPGEVRWTLERVETARFIGEPTPGPAFEAESRVTVLMVEGDTARVSVGNRYGWLRTDQLTDVEPARSTPPGLPAGLPPNIAEQLLKPPAKLGDELK
jgi:hypothetical protein